MQSTVLSGLVPPSVLLSLGSNTSNLDDAIDIQSQGSTFEEYKEEVPMSRLRQSWKTMTETYPKDQERVNNHNYNITINNNFQNHIFCQTPYESNLPSNRLQHQTTQNPYILKENSAFNSETNDSAPFTNKDNIKIAEKKRNNDRETRAQKMRDKNAFKKKIKIALNEFQQEFKGKKVAQQLKKDLYKPYAASLCVSNVQPNNQESFVFSKKITRNHFRRLKPYLDTSEDLTDRSGQLVRLSNASYRFMNPILAQKINSLASQIPRIQRQLKTKPTAAHIPDLPSLPVTSQRHKMFVNVLRLRFLRRALTIQIQ